MQNKCWSTDLNKVLPGYSCFLISINKPPSKYINKPYRSVSRLILINKRQVCLAIFPWMIKETRRESSTDWVTKRPHLADSAYSSPFPACKTHPTRAVRAWVCACVCLCGPRDGWVINLPWSPRKCPPPAQRRESAASPSPGPCWPLNGLTHWIPGWRIHIFIHEKYQSEPWLPALLAAKKAIVLLTADQRICFPRQRFLKLIAQLTDLSLLGWQASLSYMK